MLNWLVGIVVKSGGGRECHGRPECLFMREWMFPISIQFRLKFFDKLPYHVGATFLTCPYADAISSHREVCLGQLPPADLTYFRFHRLIYKQADLPL